MKKLSIALKIVTLLSFIFILSLFFPGWRYAQNDTLFEIGLFFMVIPCVTARYIDKRVGRSGHA